jgi:hypothetical protein
MANFEIERPRGQTLFPNGLWISFWDTSLQSYSLLHGLLLGSIWLTRQYCYWDLLLVIELVNYVLFHQRGRSALQPRGFSNDHHLPGLVAKISFLLLDTNRSPYNPYSLTKYVAQSSLSDLIWT